MDELKEYIKELLRRVETMSNVDYGKIGIAVNCHNRHQMAAECLAHIERFAPKNCYIVVIDDASSPPIPGATFRFEENVGIARAKNKALELLYTWGCEHLFLFDDDTYPTGPLWYKKYVDSVEPHLMYIFKDFKDGSSLGDCREIYRDGDKVAYSHPRGCMLYFERRCLDAVGGMDPAFGRWGWEHVNLSDRIFNYGLTSFPYMDVNSEGLIYSDDEVNKNAHTTIKGVERRELVARNSKIYADKKGSKEFIPFIEKMNVFLTCYFAGVPDPQRGAWDPRPIHLMPLIESVTKIGGQLIVLHDCFNVDEIQDMASDFPVRFYYMRSSINPYFQRWVSYREWLIQNRAWLNNVFCVDATDVKIINSPAWEDLGDKIYVGDENSVTGNAWMKNNHTGKVMDEFFGKYQKRQLLNAGVLGGRVDILINFMREIVEFYINLDSSSSHMTDMGAFNYVARTKFADWLRYGREITTNFKGEEKNDVSWIKHK